MLHIGLDDTDSPEGGCTTYVAAVLVERLLDLGVEFIGYPTLLRLNPNTPWKTRGNASVCLRMRLEESIYDDVLDTVKELVEKFGEFTCDNTNPGAVFFKGEVPNDVKAYSDLVVRSLVEKSQATELIERHDMDYLEYKNGRGIIGALAAIGGTLEGDMTYELLTYRAPVNWGTPRMINESSIVEMDRELSDSMFNNLDENDRPLITPRGPDPVLYGVRGETPEAVYKAMQMIKPLEPVDRWMICRSNQGTDLHFGKPVKVLELEQYNPAVVRGDVNSNPVTIEGGHVFFQLKDETGVVDCAAFEPTGSFRAIVRKLIPGDLVTVYAGVSTHEKELTLNVEKLIVHQTALKIEYLKPKCPECGGSTESMGSGQGLRCRKCGYREDLVEKVVEKERCLSPGIYLPDKGAHRHLTKPLERYGREKVVEIGF